MIYMLIIDLNKITESSSQCSETVFLLRYHSTPILFYGYRVFSNWLTGPHGRDVLISDNNFKISRKLAQESYSPPLWNTQVQHQCSRKPQIKLKVCKMAQTVCEIWTCFIQQYLITILDIK